MSKRLGRIVLLLLSCEHEKARDIQYCTVLAVLCVHFALSTHCCAVHGARLVQSASGTDVRLGLALVTAVLSPCKTIHHTPHDRQLATMASATPPTVQAARSG